MPDIAKCSGEGCPMKETCYRYTATPTEFRQSYFMNPPINRETGECDHYWMNPKERAKNYMRLKKGYKEK